MKGNPEVMKFLKDALRKELTAINQYFLHARMLKDWGVTKLGEKEYKESIEEMEHADWLIERILFLGDIPVMHELDKFKIGENVKEIIEADLALEMKAHPLYTDAVAKAEEVKDYVSRDLFAKILSSEEEHIDFLETQLDLIERMGIENYVQLQSHSAEDAEG
ncbi:MAG: bacterioferritin [Pseudomonadota bacterium]